MQILYYIFLFFLVTWPCLLIAVYILTILLYNFFQDLTHVPVFVKGLYVLFQELSQLGIEVLLDSCRKLSLYLFFQRESITCSQFFNVFVKLLLQMNAMSQLALRIQILVTYQISINEMTLIGRDAIMNIMFQMYKSMSGWNFLSVYIYIYI